MSPPEQSEGAPKHRACDECRTRKLACTKEPDGCARCKRESQVCHYSAQKPMGRPRKRPREETDDTKTAESATKTPMLDVPPDTEDPGLAFLNFLTQGDLDLNPIIPTDILGTQKENQADWSFGYTGNDFGQLNFDTSDAAVEHAPSFSASNIDPALFTTATTPADGSAPTLSSGQSSSPSSSGSPPSLLPSTNCACIAGLYLSLDSMQKLSDNITDAVRQARLAAKTAYLVVNCGSCSIPLGLDSMRPDQANPQAMHNFQLLMLLSTLIPSIAHAYERILHMVDQETARAQAERREIPFTLENYGGMWGGLATDCCDGSKALEHRKMEPAMWRLTVRALLRVDVYGIGNCEMTNDTARDPFHLGLRDIVNQMENRAKARHAIIDPLILAGTLEDPRCALKTHKTGEKPTCMRIIEIAKNAIDNLVIA